MAYDPTKMAYDATKMAYDSQSLACMMAGRTNMLKTDLMGSHLKSSDATNSLLHHLPNIASAAAGYTYNYDPLHNVTTMSAAVSGHDM